MSLEWEKDPKIIRAKQPEKEKPLTATEKARLFRSGLLAGNNGKKRESSFCIGSKEDKAWLSGYDLGRKK